MLSLSVFEMRFIVTHPLHESVVLEYPLDLRYALPTISTQTERR